MLPSRNSAWFFDGYSGSTRSDIWRWWQERRFRYNRDVLLVGVITWLLVLFAGSAAVKPGDDFEEPIMMIVGPVIYGIFANLAYTAGPIFDMAVYRAEPRKQLLKMGYILSLFLTSLPGAWALAAWLRTVATGKKLD
jgi:hypothetical protein